MLYVPVVSSTGKPLMPCHPARARELVRAGKAKRRFNKGLFYILLTERSDGFKQPVALGIDPGSKWEGFTVKSEAHTFENLNVDAVTWVKDKIETRRNMRRSRRNRKTPYRQCRWNRSTKANYDGFKLAPSTHARWDWKLRLAKWLIKLYPISCFVVEDIKAETKKGCKKWNTAFSPMENGKRWFYQGLGKLGRVETKQGFETFEMRNQMGLKKLKDKKSKSFYAHCVDSWTLANWFVGGHTKPDFERVTCITPFQWKRRQLHKLQEAAGGIRKREGSTNSLGFKRGSLVKHIKHGVMYVGGFLKDRLSLHSVQTGERLVRNAKPADCTFLAHTSWRVFRQYKKQKTYTVQSDQTQRDQNLGELDETVVNRDPQGAIHLGVRFEDVKQEEKKDEYAVRLTKLFNVIATHDGELTADAIADHMKMAKKTLLPLLESMEEAGRIYPKGLGKRGDPKKYCVSRVVVGGKVSHDPDTVYVSGDDRFVKCETSGCMHTARVDGHCWACSKSGGATCNK